MKSQNKSLRESVIDWFERNPTATIRSAPLAKALKADPTQVAETLRRLAEPGGDLLRCKVEVGPKDRTPGAAPQQWEYRLAAGKTAAPVNPYVPPAVGRRQPAKPATHSGTTHSNSVTKTPNVVQSPAGGGANNPGSQPSEVPLAPSSTEGLAVAPAATVSKMEAVAPAAAEIATAPDSDRRLFEAAISALARIDEALGIGYKGTGEPDETLTAIADLKTQIATLTGQRDAWRAVGAPLDCDTPQALSAYLEAKNAAIAAKAERVAHLEAELQVKASVIEQLRADNDTATAVAKYYAVASAKKPLARFTKREAAEARALAGAKAGRRAEIFAMVSIGTAVPGAVLKNAA